ncbi:MAG: UDP-N-acetylmuramoyl-tripeptide--D-alanyl-D-alanine ligase [Acetanaerobacterium sp.]
MERWMLSDIARLFGQGVPDGIAVCSICTDSRAITAGCLFVALEGERFDGHNFVREAFEKGAVAAICRKEVPDCAHPIIYVKDTQRALITLGCAYRLKYDMPVVAVTGSVGKTTTKDMVACAMGAHCKTLKTEGNHNNEIGLPLTLLQLDRTYGCAVIEMGMTHMGDLSLLSAATLPDVAIITNIGVSHIESLGSRENILKAKLEIAEGLPTGGTLILNYDDDLLCDIKSDRGFVIMAYGIDNPASDVVAKGIRREGEETLFTIRYQDKDYPARIPCIGRHNVLNALAAFCAAAALGLDLEKSVAALARFTPSGMRQRLVRRDGVTVIEDCYNASPDSMKAALGTLRTLTQEGKEGRSIAVLADMLELGGYSQTAHEAVGRMVRETGTDILIACGVEAAYIAQSAKAAGVEQVYYFDDKTGAGNKLARLAREGDTILFKGSRGMRLEEIIECFYAQLGKDEKVLR